MVVTKKGVKKNLIKEIQSEYSGDKSYNATNNSEPKNMKNLFKYGSSLSGIKSGVTTESFEKELGFPVKDRAETKLYKSGFIKTAAGETSYVDTQFYTPRLSGETFFLPRSRKMLLRWIRVYFDYDPYIKSILTMHSRYPISPFKLVDENREKVELFESVLHQDDWDISDTMLKGSLSMQKYGESCLLSSWNKQYGIWDNICPLDPTLIEVEEIPMTTKVNIYTEIPDKYKKIYKENINNTEALKTLPEEIIQVLKLGGDYIQLNTQEEGYLADYKPASALLLANSTDVGEGGVRGTPPAMCLLRCMHGDTKVALLDGTTPTLKELYEKGIEDFEVYNLDEKGNIAPGRAQKIIKTQKEKGLKITFDNGESIIVTKDHPLMMRNGEYVEAQNLKSGDSMMPLYFKNGCLDTMDKQQIYNPGDGKYHVHSKWLMGLCGKKETVFHINGNKNDRRTDNMVTLAIRDGMKFCTGCKEWKPIGSFSKHKAYIDGLRTQCNECKEIEASQYRNGHREQIRETSKKHYINNPEYYRNKFQNYKTIANANARKRYSEYVNVKLRSIIASRITKAVKGTKNFRTWESLVGYSIEDLKKHLEKQFTAGMSWNNYGHYTDGRLGWHIDHIKPLVSYDIKSYEDEEFKRAWSLENLQPLWATTREIDGVVYQGNINKSDSYQYLNHKIKSIKETTEEHQFYAVQNAAPYFNFAIAFNDGSGIFSKNTLVYKDFLKKAQFERAKRYAYPLEIWSLGRVSEDANNSIIPDDEDLEYVRGMLKTALANPPFTIIYNPLLNYQVFGATGALLNITEDLNFCENDMLVGLGVNKTIVLGEGSWLGTSKTIPLQRLLMDYQTDRDMWETKFLKNYVFRALCMRWGYTQEQKITGRRKILTPRVVWNRDLDPDASSEKRKDYMSLWKDKLISSETLVARYPDIDIYEEARKLEKESMTYIGQLRGLAVPKPKGEEVPEGTKPSAPESPKKPEKPKEEEKEKTDNTETKIDTEAPLTPPPPRPKEKIKVVPDKE